MVQDRVQADELAMTQEFLPLMSGRAPGRRDNCASGAGEQGPHKEDARRSHSQQLWWTSG